MRSQAPTAAPAAPASGAAPREPFAATLARLDALLLSPTSAAALAAGQQPAPLAASGPAGYYHPEPAPFGGWALLQGCPLT